MHEQAQGIITPSSGGEWKPRGYERRRIYCTLPNPFGSASAASGPAFLSCCLRYYYAVPDGAVPPSCQGKKTDGSARTRGPRARNACTTDPRAHRAEALSCFSRKARFFDGRAMRRTKRKIIIVDEVNESKYRAELRFAAKVGSTHDTGAGRRKQAKPYRDEARPEEGLAVQI